MRKIIRSEMSYSEPVSFDLEVYTMLKREDLDYLEKEIASLKEQLDRQQEQHEKAMIRAGIEITKVQDKHDDLLWELRETKSQVRFAHYSGMDAGATMGISKEALEEARQRLEMHNTGREK